MNNAAYYVYFACGMVQTKNRMHEAKSKANANECQQITRGPINNENSRKKKYENEITEMSTKNLRMQISKPTKKKIAQHNVH